MYKRNGASYNFPGGKMSYKRNIVLFGLVIMGAGLLSGEAHATEPTLTLSLSSANVSTNVAPSADATGTFVQSSPITVGVTTDNATGYTLGIKANDNTYPDRLINATDNSYLSSINSATSLATFKATDLSSITISGGNQGIWGYLPSKLNSVANTDFLPSPGTAGNIIEQTADANSTAINYTIVLGAKVSPLATLGAYTNAFTITALANPIPYTIIYAENTVTGMPDNVLDGSSGSTSVTISSTTPTRDGYAFLGWCDQATTKSGDTDTCASGHQHQPGGTVTLDATANANNIKLYAMWKPIVTFDKAFANAGKTKSNGYYKMQDINASICSAISEGQTGQLIDFRDSKNYNVAKLADGNCWMTQNLDHDIKNDGTVTYDSTTTDISSAWSPNTATYATSNTTWDYSYTAPESYDPGDLCWNGTIRSDYNGTISTDTVACGNDKHHHIGNYYNWTAAVAMNDSSSYTTQNTDVNQSICPAGWRLPISGTSNTGSKSFQYLVDQLSLTSGTSGNIQNSPVCFVYGGFWLGSSDDVGGDGLYWSSVVSDGLYAYSLYFARTGNLDPQNRDTRSYGNSVRCVAR